MPPPRLRQDDDTEHGVVPILPRQRERRAIALGAKEAGVPALQTPN